MDYPILEAETRKYWGGISPDAFVRELMKAGLLMLDWDEKHQLGVLVVGVSGRHAQNREGIIAAMGREFALNCDRVARRLGSA